MLVQLLPVKESKVIEWVFFHHLQGGDITQTIVLLIPVKAKTEHITNEKDFVLILPILPVPWTMVRKEYVYFFGK